MAAFSCRCSWRSSTVRWCTSCSMLVQAAAASCWVVVSSTVAAVPPSLSARRDSERASRRSAVIAFVDGGSGLFMSLSAMLLILVAPQPIQNRIEPRHLCRTPPPPPPTTTTITAAAHDDHRALQRPVQLRGSQQQSGRP